MSVRRHGSPGLLARRAPPPLLGALAGPEAQLAFLGQAFATYGAALIAALIRAGAAVAPRPLVAAGRHVQLELEVRTAKHRALLGLVAQLDPVAADVVYVAQAQLRVALYFRFTPYSPVHHLLQSDSLRLQTEMGDLLGWGPRTERWLEATFAPRRVCEKLHSALALQELHR
jgi:hypothetical protein